MCKPHLRVLEVVAPEGSDLVLAADVPNRERDVLVLDRLDVETDCGDCGDDLAELQFVEDGGLSGGIESNLRRDIQKMVRMSNYQWTDVYDLSETK